jgi:hypothetical protein
MKPLERFDGWVRHAQSIAKPSLEPDPLLWHFVADSLRLFRCAPVLLASRGVELPKLEASLRQAISVSTPPLAFSLSWRTEAERLARACDEGQPWEQLIAPAEGLLEALDSAELLHWFSEHGEGIESMDWSEVQAFRAWFQENTDRFFPAETLIQTYVDMFDPYLAERDLLLWATADKFHQLQDEWLGMQGLLSVSARSSLDAGWLGFPEVPLALAAAPAPDSLLFTRHWRSPQGNYRASLACHSQSQRLRVHFDAGEEPATALAGELIWLAGILGVVDAQARADFDMAALRHAQGEGTALQLSVGRSTAMWIPEG